MPSQCLIIDKLSCLLKIHGNKSLLKDAQIWKNMASILIVADNYSCLPPSHHCRFQKWSKSTTCSGLFVWWCSVRGFKFLLSRVVLSAHRFFFSVGMTSFFALIVIILGGLITHFTDTFLDGFFNYAALGIATGLLTLLTLPTMFVYRTISEKDNNSDLFAWI